MAFLDSLFGSAPRVSTQPQTYTAQPTIEGNQQGLLNAIIGMLGQTYGPNQVPSWYYNPSSTQNFGTVQGDLTGTYAAPLSDLQKQSLAGFGGLVSGLTANAGAQDAQAGTEVGTALDALHRAQSNPISLINSQQAFQKGVVEPLTMDFTQNVIPAISGQYGAGAGGAFSSDQTNARQVAGTKLAQTLSQTGANYDLEAQKANQAAQQGNATLGLTADQLLGSILGIPNQLAAGRGALLTAGLNAGAVPQETAQRQISGQFADYQMIVQNLRDNLAKALTAALSGTQQNLPATNTVVQGGSTGLIPSLLGGASQGAGAFLAKSLFSGGI